jgi:hypothetical protein
MNEEQKLSTKELVIQEVERICEFWDEEAMDAAMESVRNPENQDLRERAVILVARADTSREIRDKVIQVICHMWPVEKVK